MVSFGIMDPRGMFFRVIHLKLLLETGKYRREAFDRPGRKSTVREKNRKSREIYNSSLKIL